MITYGSGCRDESENCYADMDCLSVFKYPNSHHSLGYFLVITESGPKSSENNDLSSISTSTNCMDL